MENDVNSPVSTCSSDISLSVGTTDSCIICFCSDEETESHDCNVCRKGSWKVCIECKEKLKKLKKCPVCASENDNYISESELDEIGRREDVGNIYSERRRVKKLWLNLISCIFFACLGFFSVFFLSDFYDNQNCILIYFIAIMNGLISMLIVLTHITDQELGRCYSMYFFPILFSFMLFLTIVLNNYCFFLFTDEHLIPLIILLLISVFCLLHMSIKYCDL